MARKSSSQLGFGKIAVIVLLIAVVGGILIHMNSGKDSEKSSVKNTIPVEEYRRLGSSLRDNEYVLYGKVENRDTIGGGELITLIIKTEDGQEERLPIIVSPEARMVNIEREQSYRFVVKVENRGDNIKGLIIAKEITQ